jgi:hypothetical protein
MNSKIKGGAVLHARQKQKQVNLVFFLINRFYENTIKQK